MSVKVSLAAALLACLAGVLLGRLLHLSEFGAVSMGFVPSLLIAFPAIRAFMGTALKFWQWALTVGLSVLSTWLIYFVAGR